MNNALRLMSKREAVFDERLWQDVRASLADEQPPSPIDDVFKRLRGR
jgi:hypothetical protein